MTTQHYHYALGRRKSATARIRLMTGKGKFTVNQTDVADYLAGSKALLSEIIQPFNCFRA